MQSLCLEQAIFTHICVQRSFHTQTHTHTNLHTHTCIHAYTCMYVSMCSDGEIVLPVNLKEGILSHSKLQVTDQSVFKSVQKHHGPVFTAGAASFYSCSVYGKLGKGFVESEKKKILSCRGSQSCHKLNGKSTNAKQSFLFCKSFLGCVCVCVCV